MSESTPSNPSTSNESYSSNGSNDSTASKSPKLITIAIHTFDRAQQMRTLLEREGIAVTLQNVNLETPEVSSGVRVRIDQNELPLALRIIENAEIFAPEAIKALNSFEPLVLVPVDFSEHSYLAALIACHIAKNQKTGITLHHSYMHQPDAPTLELSAHLTLESSSDKENREKARKTAQEKMEQFAERLRQDMKAGRIPPVRFLTHISEGIPEDNISALSKEQRPKMVVMGTRSAQRKDKEMIGSVTAQVLDLTRFPVLSVPEDLKLPDEFHLDNVVFFTSLDQRDILAIDALYRLFPEGKTHVTLIDRPSKRRLTANNDQGKKSLLDYCAKHYPNFTFEYRDIPFDSYITDLAPLKEQIHPNLLVLPNRRKNPFTRFFNPGLAHQILFRADLPMLVIPV